MAIEANARRAILACLLLMLAGDLGCSNLPDLTNRTEEEPPRLASTIHVADPRVASQLVSGWHPVEQNAWRWTAKKFSVALRPPLGSSRDGAVLTFQFTVPDVVLSRLKSVTLAASIGETALASQTYTKLGESTYVREIPASFVADSVRIDFALAEAMPPGALDARELGIIATRIAIDPKCRYHLAQGNPLR